MFRSLLNEIEIPINDIFSVNLFLMRESSNAYFLMIDNNINIEKSFIIRNNRKPSDYQLKFIDNIINNKIIINADFYYDCYHLYVAQAIKFEYPLLMVDTDTIIKYYKMFFYNEPKEDNIHKIGRLLRVGDYKLFSKYGYNIYNIYQLYSISSIINYNNISNNSNNIYKIFNKIYKRNPIIEEINIILNLNLDNETTEIENEIRKYIPEININFRSRNRYFEYRYQS
jgi:hypothetical protein